jgi:hypothetical protein
MTRVRHDTSMTQLFYQCNAGGQAWKMGGFGRYAEVAH